MNIEWFNTWWFSWGRGIELVNMCNDSGERALLKIAWYERTGWAVDVLFIHLKEDM